MSFTDYEHDEIEGEEVATTFRNKASDIRFELTHKPIAGLRGVVGVQYADSNFSAICEEAFLPPSDTRNTALFLMETLNAGPVRLELAARQEWQKIEASPNREASHNPFSVSGAAVWDIDGDRYRWPVRSALPTFRNSMLAVSTLPRTRLNWARPPSARRRRGPSM